MTEGMQPLCTAASGQLLHWKVVTGNSVSRSANCRVSPKRKTVRGSDNSIEASAREKSKASASTLSKDPAGRSRPCRSD